MVVGDRERGFVNFGTNRSCCATFTWSLSPVLCFS